MSLGDFAQKFLEFSQTEKRRATYEADRLALDKLLADQDFGPNKLLSQITSLDLQNFLGPAQEGRVQGQLPGGALPPPEGRLRQGQALEIHPGKPFCRHLGAQGAAV
jgi:hypothetical protein